MGVSNKTQEMDGNGIWHVIFAFLRLVGSKTASGVQLCLNLAMINEIECNAAPTEFGLLVQNTSYS